MAKSRIKGITIELGADTASLEGALSDVNKKSKKLADELKDVEKLLKFNPNNTQLLAQKQELLTKSIAATTEKLNQLKQAEAQVQAQFERGDISEEQYRGFQRELMQTEQALQRYTESLQDMQTEQQRVGEGTRRLSTFFEASGTAVEDYANVIGQRLVRAIQNGTATSRDLEYAFQRIGRQAVGANGDIEHLRNTLQSVDDGNSLQNIRRELQRISQEADEAEDSMGDLEIGIENVAGALMAGGGISEAVEKSLEAASLDTKVNMVLDLPEESVQAVKNSVASVTAKIEDQEAALSGTRKLWLLNKDASDETNAKIAEGAAAIAMAWDDIDYGELIQETHEIGKEFEISQGEAISLVDSLLKAKFPPDQLDIISEYGAQLKRAGYNAEEIRGIFAAGVETGTWNIDVLLDGLKEGRIVLAEFGAGVDDSTKALIDGTGISAQQLQSWGQAVAEGGEKGKNAMVEAAEAVNAIDDATTKNQVGVKLFGTLYEENGTKITDTIINAKGEVQSLDEMQQKLNETVSQANADPAVQMRQAFSDMLIALQSLLMVIAQFITVIAQWTSQNPVLAASIAAVVTGLGILIGILFTLAPIVTGMVTLAGALGISIGAISWPVLAVVAAIAALIAIGVALYQNWDTVKAKATELWNKLGPFQGVFLALTGPIGTLIAAGVRLYQNWDTIKAKATELRNKIANLFSNIKWDLPKIKLPHFSLSGDFSLKNKTVPKLSVEWYDKGGIFSGPQIIGVGEKRPEFVGALDDLHAIVKSAMQDVLSIETSQSQPTAVPTIDQSPLVVLLNQQLEQSKQQLNVLLQIAAKNLKIDGDSLTNFINIKQASKTGIYGAMKG